jgi:class 3 adenylate cyclase
MTFFTCPEARGPNADAPCHEVDGKSLSPAAVAHGDPERRLITVLFADLVGSMELAGHLDPEELSVVLGGYRDCCTALVQ